MLGQLKLEQSGNCLCLVSLNESPFANQGHSTFVEHSIRFAPNAGVVGRVVIQDGKIDVFVPH